MDKAKVLIVDDMKSNRLVMGEVLHELDVDLLMASSGKEALTLLSTNEVAVVLLDVEMPDMNGYDTAKNIAKSHECCPPIIFVTATHQEKTHMDKGYNEGAIDYLLKPLDPIIVNAKVKAFITLYQQRKTIEETNAKLANFASMVCHDGKAPLRHTMFYLQFAMEEDNLSEEVKDHLTNAYANCQRMSQFYDDLYKFTLAKGEIEERELVDIHVIVEQLKDMLQENIANNKATVTGICLQPLYTGKTELSLILQNLIANALKFKSETSAPRIDISGHDTNDGKYEIHVTDNGIGIEEEYFQKIFEAFRRLHGSNKYPGSGLGLSTCKKLAEYLGGSMHVTNNLSSPNNPTNGSESGVTFVITLPHLQPA